MTDVMGETNPGGGPFFIWDRSASKFVRADQASADQMRLYGSALYTSFGSGRSRVMTSIDPQGRATSYAVEQSTRRGELVPAGRAAGRANLGEVRAGERAEERAVAAERRSKVEAIQVDVQQQSLWQTMDLRTKQLLYADPTLLEGIDLGALDQATIMDYVFFGTPRSPGLFMEGVSNEYVWVPELRRFKNAMFASEEERMNSRVYTREEATGPQLGQFEPLDETLRGQFERVAGAVGEVVVAGDRSIDQLLPEDAIITVYERDAYGRDVPTGTAYNPDVLGPWITSNFDSLSAAQRKDLADVVQFARASYDETIAATLSPEELRTVRGRGLNPWDAVVVRTENYQTQAQLTPEKRAELEEQRMVSAQQTARRFSGRYSQEVIDDDSNRKLRERADYLNAIATNVQQKIENRYLSYEFESIPLGFVPGQFVQGPAAATNQLFERQRELSNIITARQQSGGGGATAAETAEMRELTSMLQNPPTTFQFRQGMAPITRGDRARVSAARATAEAGVMDPQFNYLIQNRLNRELVGEQPQTKPLTEARAFTMLQSISTDPASMSRLKQRLVWLGAEDKNFISDTSIDAETVSYWNLAVEQANLVGMDPETWLSQVQLDPTARDRAAARNRGSGPPAFTVRLPSTDDVATIVQDVSTRRLGQRIDSEQAKQIAQAYVQMAEAQYRSQQGATTITEPMSAETFSEQQIGRQFGADERIYQTGLQLDTLIEMIGG